MSEIGDIVKNKRIGLGLTATQVVKIAGYKNITKGLNRLSEIESGRKLFPKASVLTRFAALLGIETHEFISAAQREWSNLDRPFEPELIEVIKVPVVCSHRLPEGCTPDEAREIARTLAIKNGHIFSLSLSPVRSESFFPSGAVRNSQWITRYLQGFREIGCRDTGKRRS